MSVISWSTLCHLLLVLHSHRCQLSHPSSVSEELTGFNVTCQLLSLSLCHMCQLRQLTPVHLLLSLCHLLLVLPCHRCQLSRLTSVSLCEKSLLTWPTLVSCFYCHFVTCQLHKLTPVCLLLSLCHLLLVSLSQVSAESLVISVTVRRVCWLDRHLLAAFIVTL